MIDKSSILDILQTNYGYTGNFIDIFTDWTIANTLDIEGSVEYGYDNFNLSARIPTKIFNYPKTYSESVTYWGTDIYEFSATSSPSNLKIEFFGDITGDFSISTLTYSTKYSNWTINSFKSSSIENNELHLFISKFTLNDNSKVILLISSVDGLSSGVDVVNEVDFQNDYNLYAELASIEIIYNQFDSSDNLVIMKGIVVEDPLNLWNESSIVYANYSIVNLDSNKTIKHSQNLTYNVISSTYELEVSKSLLLPGTYQIRIFISNSTTVLELLSPEFEISFEDFAYFNYNSQTMTVIINSIYLEALNPSWNVSSIIYANFSIIDANTKEIIKDFSQNLAYNEISSTYELEVDVSLLSKGMYKIFIFISNGTSNFEIFSPTFEITTENPTESTPTTPTTPTPTNSADDSSTNKSITTTPLFLNLFTLFLGFVVLSYPIIKRRKEKT
ncbi:MAG: hypothetical protein HeimC3_54820 [Candidatus Heimdallarchaeota archaeon LC_3]|nr:MAG: hypothetical protein HeimC3_54820 [Candidatus Heimdallarchaeota archaeon LC_3]